MHDEEAEAITNREILESDGTMKALGIDAFPPVFFGDDGRSILLFQRDLDGCIVRLWAPDDAMTRDGEHCQEIWRKEEREERGERWIG